MGQQEKKEQKFVFDDRYESVEKRLLPLAHVRPTVFRFIMLTEVLEKGFEEALREPLDQHLGDQPWLAACLTLLCESPLSAPENDWKFSLTVQDVRAIEETMRNPLWLIAKWHRTVCNASPMNRPDYVGGLLEAVDKSLIQPFIRYHEEENASFLDFPPHPHTTFDGNGNAVYDNGIALGLLRGCTVKGAVARYAEAPIRNQDHFEMLELACEGEYDHLTACQTAGERMRQAVHYLAEREKKFDSLIDSPARYHVLELPLTQEPVFTFLSGEFDEPVELHLAHEDDPPLTKMMREKLDFIVSRIRHSVDLVLKAASGTDAALKFEAAWAALIGRFERRFLQGAVPSYIEQEQFHRALCEFRSLYNAAIAQCTKHPAQSTLHPAQSTLHPAQSTQHPAQSTQHKAQGTNQIDRIFKAIDALKNDSAANRDMFLRACAGLDVLAEGAAKVSSAVPVARVATAALKTAANNLGTRYAGVGLERIRDAGKKTQVKAVIDYTWDETPVALNRAARDDVRQPLSMNKIVAIVWAANKDDAWARMTDGYASEGALFQQCNRMLKRTGNVRNPFNTVQ